MSVEMMQMHWCDSEVPLQEVYHGLTPVPSPDKTLAYAWAIHADGTVCNEPAAFLRISELDAKIKDALREEVAEVLDDLIDRMNRGQGALAEIASTHELQCDDGCPEPIRLRGKAQGMGVARGYVHDTKRIRGL